LILKYFITFSNISGNVWFFNPKRTFMKGHEVNLLRFENVLNLRHPGHPGVSQSKINLN